MRMFRKLIRDEWVKVLSFTVLMSAISIVQVVFWPNIEKVMPAIADAMPDIFKGMFGGIATEGFYFYIITQQLMKSIGIFGTGLAIMLGASAVARELESGTMELLLAQPISRTRVLVEKFFFNGIMLLIPFVLSTMLIWPTAPLIGESIDATALLVGSLYTYSVLLVVYAFTFMLGTMIDEQMKVMSISLGACIVMMLLFIFEETAPFSLFHYLDIDVLRPIFTVGRIPWRMGLVFLALSGGLFGVAWFRFRKRTI